MRNEIARSSFAVLLGLAIIVPFLNYHRVSPSPTIYSELASIFLFLSAFAIGARLLGRRAAISGSLAVFCAGLLALLLYQVVDGGYYQFMLWWASWAAFLVLFFLAAAFGQTIAADAELRAFVVQRLAAAIVFAALFNAFAQVAQVTQWSMQIRPIVFIPDADNFALYTCAPGGNVAQRNHTNALAWLGVASLLHAVATRRVRPVYSIAGLFVLLFSSALTSSRMAWLMAIAVAGLVTLGRGGLGWPLRRSVAVAASLVVGLFLATVLREWLVTGCLSSLDRTLSSVGAGGQAKGGDLWIRTELVRQSLLVWSSQPWLGVGVGRFMAKTFALETRLDEVQPLDFSPHNAALDILVSFGVAGFVLLLACGLPWVVRSWRRRRESVDQFLLLAALAVIAIPATFELALWFSYFLIPFGLMLGMAIGPAGERAFSLRLPWRWVFPIAALAGLPLLGLAARDHAHAERVMWLGQIARGQSPLAGGAASALPNAAQELTLFAVWGEHEMLRFGSESRKDLPGQLAANQRLIDSIPDPHIVARRVMLEILSGRPEVARELIRRTMVFFPEHLESVEQQLRRRAGAHAEAGADLVKILDEEMARPPRRRG